MHNKPVALLAVFSSCFPGPLDLGPDADGLSGEDIGETVGENETLIGETEDAAETTPPDGDATGCVGDEACNHLDGPCRVGRCLENGECVALARDADCDDENPCTKDDTCAGTECIGTPYTCDDSLTCTSDSCDGTGACVEQLTPDTCLVDGICYSQGDHAPGNPCRECISGTSWSDLDATDCEDGDPCTANDTCRIGVCVGGPVPTDNDSDWIFDPLVALVDNPALDTPDLRSNSAITVSAAGRSPAAFDANGVLKWQIVSPERLRLLSIAPDGQATLGGGCHWVRINGEEMSPPSDLEGVCGSGLGCGCRYTLDAAGLMTGRVDRAVSRAQFSDGSILGTVGYDDLLRASDLGNIWHVALERAPPPRVPSSLRILATDVDANDGTTAVVVSDDGITAESGPWTITVDGPSVTAIIRVLADGTIAWATPLARVYVGFALDWDSGTAQIATHPSGEITVVGSTFGRSVQFGSPLNPVDYMAGDDVESGYIARVDMNGELLWAHFLRPNDRTAVFTDVSAIGEDALVAGFYTESAMLTDADGARPVSDVVGEADPEIKRFGSVVARYTREGRLAWNLGHQGRALAVARSDDGPAIQVVMHVCEGDVGFPARVPSPLSDCRLVVVSFNSRGGFECSEQLDN